ncbi:IS3 family transposase [Lysinibacillus sp. NPDC048646]|uniref:IS3 family transposase n=1 Tax=Lysinibacillus sp. NPDC048646 TaxID=3390574 RepID=UPI003CFCD4E4
MTAQGFDSLRKRKDMQVTLLNLKATKFPKATYMYWQKRFDRENPDKEIERVMKEIFEENDGNYGYRRMDDELRDRGIIVNHKKIQRIKRKLGLQSVKFTRKSRKYSTYKGTDGTVEKNRIHRRFYTSIPH